MKRLLFWLFQTRTPEAEEIRHQQQALANAMLCCMI